MTSSGGETTRGKRPGGNGLWGETTRGGNGLGQILVSFFLDMTWTSGPYANFCNLKVFNIAEKEI